MCPLVKRKLSPALLATMQDSFNKLEDAGVAISEEVAEMINKAVTQFPSKEDLDKSVK